MTTPADEEIVHPGDVLGGKYVVERVLGAGGMGVVIAVRHLELGSRVALKLMRPERARDPASAERFLREARAAVRLRSEHAAHVLDVGKLADGAPYLVMELLVGMDLAELVAVHGPREPREAADYVLQACDAIAEAHALGIVHRDLKLNNLFLTSAADGRPLVKVLDFGLAKTLEASPELRALTQSTEIMGSPEYMSPEQLAASRDVDPRTDVWSLGVCLYELVAGRTPFWGGTVPETFSRILRDEPWPLPRSVPRGFGKVIARCLEKRPAQRYPDIAALAHALRPLAPAPGARPPAEGILSGPRVRPASAPRGADPMFETRTASTIDTPWATSRRRGSIATRAAFAVAAAVVVVGAGTGALFSIQTTKGRAQGASAGTAAPLPDPSPAAGAAASAIESPGLPAAPSPGPSSAPFAAAASPAIPSTPSATPPTGRPRRHAPGHRPAAAPVTAPAAEAPTLKPKTTEF